MEAVHYLDEYFHKYRGGTFTINVIVIVIPTFLPQFLNKARISKDALIVSHRHTFLFQVTCEGWVT